MDIGRLEHLLEELPAGGQALSLRKLADGQWEIGWIGGMSGGEYGIRPTVAEAVELAHEEIFGA